MPKSKSPSKHNQLLARLTALDMKSSKRHGETHGQLDRLLTESQSQAAVLTKIRVDTPRDLTEVKSLLRPLTQPSASGERLTPMLVTLRDEWRHHLMGIRDRQEAAMNTAHNLGSLVRACLNHLEGQGSKLKTVLERQERLGAKSDADHALIATQLGEAVRNLDNQYGALARALADLENQMAERFDSLDARSASAPGLTPTAGDAQPE